jgi:hypothetical protein
MKFIPYEKYVLLSKLSTHEIRTRVANSIMQKKYFPYEWNRKNNTKPYEGELSYSGFIINRIIWGANPYLPIIKGVYWESSDCTLIKIEMRLLRYGITMSVFFFSILLYAFFRVISEGLYAHPKIYILLFALMVIPYLFMTVTFWTECKKSKRYLSHLLEGKEAKLDQNK